jgi:hypothetical protein
MHVLYEKKLHQLTRQPRHSHILQHIDAYRPRRHGESGSRRRSSHTSKEEEKNGARARGHGVIPTFPGPHLPDLQATIRVDQYTPKKPRNKKEKIETRVKGAPLLRFLKKKKKLPNCHLTSQFSHSSTQIKSRILAAVAGVATTPIV